MTAQSALGPENRPETFVLDLEGTDHIWHHDTITVGQIRKLADWPNNQQVVEIDPATNTEVTLDDTKPIELEKGRSFGRKFKFKRGNK